MTYEATKRVLSATTTDYAPFVHMAAASCGETVACTVRVPTEVIKQRMQTKQFNKTSATVSHVLRTEGILGMYRGFLSTVAREIPFTCIQFPLYEYFKRTYAISQGRPTEPFEAALMGSVAGGIAAAATTPLDVCKTRIMLSHRVSPKNTYIYICIYSRDINWKLESINWKTLYWHHIYYETYSC